ncbi:hypothetical protein B0H14DRAFT_3585124 [Mycena olivaceomarginata]|nr:hypothetical protein B0H14DRAFT_3585124 [Mycena olivaceomarginata]
MPPKTPPTLDEISRGPINTSRTLIELLVIAGALGIATDKQRKADLISAIKSKFENDPALGQQDMFIKFNNYRPSEIQGKKNDKNAQNSADKAAQDTLAAKQDLPATGANLKLLAGGAKSDPPLQHQRLSSPVPKKDAEEEEDARARAQSKAHKETKGLDTTAQSGRDKFMALNRPEMPSMITAWVAALAAVDRSHPPYCSTGLPQLYVLPEPALLAAPEDETHCCGLYHHYRLMRDALMFHLAHHSQCLGLLTIQQWCNILQGKVTKQGKVGSRAQARSTSLEELLAPAFRACGIDALVEFPVPPEAIPPPCWALWQENLAASVAWAPQV